MSMNVIWIFTLLYVQVYKGKQYNTDNTLGLFKILVIIFILILYSHEQIYEIYEIILKNIKFWACISVKCLY